MAYTITIETPTIIQMKIFTQSTCIVYFIGLKNLYQIVVTHTHTDFWDLKGFNMVWAKVW